MKEKCLERLKNKQDLVLDFQNGILLNLTFDKDIDAYRGHLEDIDIGIWNIKTIYEMINDPSWKIKVLEGGKNV